MIMATTIETQLKQPVLAAEATVQPQSKRVATTAGEVRSGPGAAALLAAGIGSAALGVFALLGDAFKGMAGFFNFYKPTGPLSGVTTSAIVVWLVAWFLLARRWEGVDVDTRKVSIFAFVLLAIGFAFTFPPIMDFVQGK
jgi:hypothetical protein